MRSDAHRRFHRPARVFPAPVEGGELRIAPPPATMPAGANGLVQVVLPLLGSMGMVGLAVVLGDPRFMAMAGAMALAMLVSGFVARASQRRSARRSHDDTVGRYRRHLADVDRELRASAHRQRHRDAVCTPPAEALWPIVVDRRRVWERRPFHDDFSRVRIGTGSTPPALVPVLDRMTDPTASREPALEAEAADLADRHRLATGTAITLDLSDCASVAIVGDPEETRALARCVLLQLATFCAPDDLRVVLAHQPDGEREWEWATSLPHARLDGERSVTSEPEALAAMLGQLIGPRIDADHHPGGVSTRRAVLPHVALVIDDYRPDEGAGGLDIVDDLLARGADVGVSVVCITRSASTIPSTAGATVSIDCGTVSVSRAQPAAVATGRSERASLELCSSVAGALGPLRLRERTGRAATVDSPGLFELLGIEPDAFTPGAGRPELPAEHHLQAPIGVTHDGEPLVLDLKESSSGGMGPHGLLIGATGSGKSELLRTLVLGLAARHSPEDLAFVLVDFKGGATFARIDRLPHSAGLITNLERDPVMVERMLHALHGELERRQRILHDAGFDRAVDYRAHRRRQGERELEALPALLMVVDEFGELLAARREFGDLFATIGRQGRSLGVHLLLSTQRIEDGRIRMLEGHLRYRLCLRTFTAEESTNVIGTRAAAELPPIPGVGYLKVDGILTAFKGGYATRPVRAAARTEMDHLIDRLGSADPPVGRARPVWLEPLPATVPLGTPVAPVAAPGGDGWLRAPVGVADDPRNQRQVTHELDLSGAGGNVAVVGGPRSGKSTLLQTLVVSLAARHDPFDLQVYGIDMGGGTLSLVGALPHVGAMLGRGDLPEIGQLIRRLARLVEERSDRFRRHRLVDMAGYHRLRDDGRLDDEFGEVVLVVDNWAALLGDLPEETADQLSAVLAGGLHHGVHVVLATTRWQDLRLATRDHLGGRFELRLSDPADSEIDRSLARSIPPGLPGRGIDQAKLLVQVALPRPQEADPGGLVAGIETMAREIAARSAGRPAAPPILTLPERVQLEELPASPGRPTPLGIEEHRLGPWSVDLLTGDPHMLVLGDAESGKTNLLGLVAHQLTTRLPPSEVRIAVVDYRRRLQANVPAEQRFGDVASTPETALALANRIVRELAPRGLVDPTDRVGWPAVVLLVDDYDLVSGVNGNPLSPLVDVLARGRDLRLHVVLARRVGGIARASFEPFYQRLREIGTPGIVLDGDPGEGAVLGPARAARRPPGRGLWVERGRVVEVQAALVPSWPPASEIPPAPHPPPVHRLERRAG